MKILVDADACPVKDTIISVASKANVHVILVKSFAHFSHNKDKEEIETIYVDSEREAADYKIIQLSNRGDIIVTQDYGLASLGLSKGCRVLHHKGFVYTEDNIDQLLESRYRSAMERKSGIRTKGPKAYTKKDREKFEELLKDILDV